MIETIIKEKYYTYRYDRPFKEIFLKEKNKDMLKDLLELILKVKIENITLGPNERNTGNINVKRKTYDALLYTDVGKIEIEVNANNKKHIYPRNMAYICDLYSHHTLIKETYNEDTMIVQINMSYELGKSKRPISTYEIRDEEGGLFVKNFQIKEINMDYFVNLWYDNEKKDNSLIEKNKILIMLGLEKEELEKLSKDYEEVNRYMEELDELNLDEEFREYMSEEEDKRKIFNSELREARETGYSEGHDEGYDDGYNVGRDEGYNNGLEQGFGDGHELGIKEGFEQGIEQGIEQSSISIAKNLLDMKMSIEDISKATGLSEEEIRKINNN